MELDERKMKILKAIISTYLETGDPVGSRTIAKDSDLHLSSATIRNEMADLEAVSYTHLDVYKRQILYNKRTGKLFFFAGTFLYCG